MFAKSCLRAFAVAAAILAGTGARAAAPTCSDFQEAFARAAPELKPQFTRSVVVSRGAASGDVRELTTSARVEGRLV
jgi:hypothetical protein